MRDRAGNVGSVACERGSTSCRRTFTPDGSRRSRAHYRRIVGPRVLKAGRSKPSEVKAQFGNANTLQDGRVVFNIGGNKYRIVAWINYPYRIVYIRFIGTHRQYDAIDAQTI